jgi:Dolichyl-phosphate-mannose-protein mannosyltransferase
MKSFLQRNHRIVFYTAWLLLALIQSAYTELMDDEAYYWVYSRYPSWGYYDHPPMIALMIRLGYFFFQNEFGVRLVAVIMNGLTLFFIEKLLANKNPKLFYAIALSILAFQVNGFIAAPDIPLIFFTAVFFLCYKNFIEKTSLLNTFCLGICAALLLYTKYQGVLIILFTLISNPKLFTRYQTYLAGTITLLCFMPHLLWQYQHDWVSLRYHLFESNVNPYRLSFTLEYLIGQVLIAGPFAGFILLPAAFLYKPSNATENALRVSLIGIYSVFLVSSFRGKTEANWTAPVLVSLMVLSHGYLNSNSKLRSAIFQLLPLSLLVTLFARIIMIADILPIHFVKEQYHAWRNWPAQMKTRTKNLPVVFNNSYQRASKYWFYTEQTTYSLNDYRSRKNNYNLWPTEDSMLGKQVYILDIYDLYKFPDSIKTPLGWLGYRIDPSFASFAKINIFVSNKRYSLKVDGVLKLSCRVDIPAHYAEFITSHPDLYTEVLIGIFKSDGFIKNVFLPYSLQRINMKREFEIKFNPRLKKGKYYLKFAIRAGNNIATHNSEKIPLFIE